MTFPKYCFSHTYWLVALKLAERVSAHPVQHFPSVATGGNTRWVPVLHRAVIYPDSSLATENVGLAALQGPTNIYWMVFDRKKLLWLYSTHKYGVLLPLEIWRSSKGHSVHLLRIKLSKDAILQTLFRLLCLFFYFTTVLVNNSWVSRFIGLLFLFSSASQRVIKICTRCVTSEKNVMWLSLLKILFFSLDRYVGNVGYILGVILILGRLGAFPETHTKNKSNC